METRLLIIHVARIVVLSTPSAITGIQATQKAIKGSVLADHLAHQAVDDYQSLRPPQILFFLYHWSGQVQNKPPGQ